VSKFTPFPVPIKPDDTPLVQWNREDYKCSGCGGSIPHGVWLHETIEDDMVVGLLARVGADGEVVHQCGKAAD
jgi:hypothetical protein